MELEDLPGAVVEFKKDVYTAVARDFVPLIKSLRENGGLKRKPS